MAKKKPVVWLVDDDPYFRKKYVEQMKGVVRVVPFENLFDASSSGAESPAIIMIDISAVDPLMGIGSSLHATYAPIAKMGDLYPGAILVIGSALPQNLVEDIAKDVRDVVENVVKVFEWVGGSQQFERAAKYLKTLLP